MESTIDIEVSDKELIFLTLKAHRQDITLNKLINNILLELLEKEIEEK